MELRAQLTLRDETISESCRRASALSDQLASATTKHKAELRSAQDEIETLRVQRNPAFCLADKSVASDPEPRDLISPIALDLARQAEQQALDELQHEAEGVRNEDLAREKTTNNK